MRNFPTPLPLRSGWTTTDSIQTALGLEGTRQILDVPNTLLQLSGPSKFFTSAKTVGNVSLEASMDLILSVRLLGHSWLRMLQHSSPTEADFAQ